MIRSAALDEAFLGFVRAFARGEPACDEQTFDQHARKTFAYQLATNEPYARFAAARGFGPQRLPKNWREIPAVPAAAFKDAVLTTFDPRQAELVFHSSGTTAQKAGKHYFERAALYDAALMAGFDRFVLPDRPRLRYLNLVPDPRTAVHSSLGYMMGHVSVLRGDGAAGWYLRDDGIDTPGFAKALTLAVAQRQPVCISGTAFALVALLDALASDAVSFAAPPGSRIMETGGFKGRSRVVAREELYAELTARLGVPADAIIAEYGMTELTTQYYDAPQSRLREPRVKVAPPWLRTLVVDGDGRELAPGDVGFLRHLDLGNRSSVVAVQTEDRGYTSGAGIVLLGREIDAPARGCSLDAEDLVSRTR